MAEQHPPAEQRPPDVPPQHDNPAVAHEHSDVNVSGIVKFAVGLVVFAVLAHLVLAWLFGVLARKTDRAQPKLTPLAKRERETEQQQAEERRKKAVADPRSSPAPQPPLVYERLQQRRAGEGPQLQVSDAADLETLRQQEYRNLRILGGLDEKARSTRAEIDRRVLEQALTALKGNPEAARRLGLQRQPAKKAGPPAPEKKTAEKTGKGAR